MVTARYALRELLSVFLVVAVVLLLIGLGGRFVGYLQDAALGKYSGDVLFTLLVYRLPEFLQLIFPFALFLAVLLTFSRWYADSEMTVLVAAGAAPARVLVWALAGAALIATVVGVMSLLITPKYALALDNALIEQRENREFEALTPGVFHSLYRGKRVTYTESMDEDRQNLRNVFIGERHEDGSRTTIWAESGSQYEDPKTGSRFLLLKNGRRYEGTPGQGSYRMLRFDRLSQRIETPNIERREAKVRTVSTPQLLRGKLDDSAERKAEHAAELHWRIALPLMTLIATLLAFTLAKVRPREGRFARVLPAIGLFILYYLCLLLLKQAIGDGKVPGAVGLWPVHVLFVGVGYVLFQRAQRPAAT